MLHVEQQTPPINVSRGTVYMQGCVSRGTHIARFNVFHVEQQIPLQMFHVKRFMCGSMFHVKHYLFYPAMFHVKHPMLRPLERQKVDVSRETSTFFYSGFFKICAYARGYPAEHRFFFGI